MMMTQSHTAGAALRTATDQTAAAGGIAALVANAIKAVTVDAGQTAAGVAAFMAPFTGPAAVGIGEAAGASVMGLGAFGGLYDSGAWSIDLDQFAGLHKRRNGRTAARRHRR
jgi:hypothetical protein